MISASIIIGVVGLLGSGLLARLGHRRSLLSGAGHWAVGLVGSLPGWLVAFWGLLGPSAGRPRPGPAIAWIVSSTVGLLGVIVTDAIASRWRQASAHAGPFIQWILGVLALVPAWLVALIGLAWAR